MIIKIADYIGTNAITIDQGINHLAAPFANFSVGRLLKHRTLEEFNEQVKIVNLYKDWEYDFFKLIAKNANRYYRDANYRQAVDKSIEEKSQEDYDWH